MRERYILLILGQSAAVYCLAKQAERSVAHTWGGGWEDFREFYTNDRLSLLTANLDSLHQLLDSHGPRHPCVSSEIFVKRLSLPYLIRKAVSFCSSIFDHDAKFRADELEFMCAIFGKMVSWLGKEASPPHHEEVKLLSDLCYIEALAAYRCPRIHRIPNIQMVENAFQPEFLMHYRVEEILRC